MRYPAGHKDEVRSRIVAAASRALRQHGLAGISIPALMKKAGLTHGGFYGHFRSRDELVSEAVAFAGEETGTRVLGRDRRLDDMLAAYLSKEHVDHPASGCVLAALGAESARQPTAVRRAFARTARGFLALLEQKRHPNARADRVSDDTLELAVRMIGAVVLARVVHDDAMAERILAIARDA